MGKLSPKSVVPPSIDEKKARYAAARESLHALWAGEPDTNAGRRELNCTGVRLCEMDRVA